MRVIFTGDPAELAQEGGLSRTSTTIFGKRFPMSAEVDVSDLPEGQRKKLVNNPHFRVVGVDAPAVPLVVPVSARAEADVEKATSEASGEEVASALRQRAPRKAG